MEYKFYYIFLLSLFVNDHLLAQQTLISKDSIEVLNALGRENIDNLEYKKAIEVATQIISEGKDQDNAYFTFVGYDLMGTINIDMKDTLQARLNYEKALTIVKEKNIDSLLSLGYLNLGNVESDEKENYQKGIEYYKKSIEINSIQGSEENNSRPLINIAWTYLDENQIDTSLPYLIKAKNLLKKQEDNASPKAMAILNTLFGRYHTHKKNYRIAEEAFIEAEAIIEKEKFVQGSLELYKYYSNLAEIQKDYKKAFTLLKKLKVLDEKKYEADKLREIQAANANFNIKEFERTIESAQKEQLINNKLFEKSRDLRNIFIIASLILLIALIAIFFAFKSRKKYIKRLHENNNQLMSAKNEAERLSQLKTQFFSTVSHELRTPLYGVIGLASILLEDETSKNKEDLKSLKFSADYLLALINDVLLINKMDANGITLEKTSYRLSSLTKSIIRSFEFSLEQNNNKIHLHIDKNLPDKQIGDYVRLSQILMNLIGNAIKFNEDGNIWVSIDLVEKINTGLYKTKFTIKDDGIGIPISKQKIVFEEFSQVENRNYNYQGTGLGLPIVKKLLALYDSEVVLKSEMGKGSVFTFTINLEANTSDENKEEKENYKEGDAIHIFENLHILVVDDNRINQKITQKILKKRQFKCSLADDGEQAITLAKENNYDLILMDIHMPKVDGVEATKAIRKFNKEIPIVALTAVELDEMRATIMNSGMNDIILKPYDISQFLTTILRNLNKALIKSR